MVLEPRGADLKSMGAHRPNKNANGMLSLFPEADIIASETNGPMNAEVLPIYRISLQRMTPYMIELDYYHGEQGKEKEPA